MMGRRKPFPKPFTGKGEITVECAYEAQKNERLVGKSVVAQRKEAPPPKDLTISAPRAPGNQNINLFLVPLCFGGKDYFMTGS